MSDLKDRLRKWPVARVNDQTSPCDEAADYIDALEAALREIAEQDIVELNLDPDWPRRIARAALSPTPER